MVGSAFQAVIPIGLFKYGDVLPYENEDSLIWEPSQVSEKEVEDYLIEVQDMNSSHSDDEQTDALDLSEASTSNKNKVKSPTSSEISISSTSSPSTLYNGSLKNNNVVIEATNDTEKSTYIRDNEQVYDFSFFFFFWKNVLLLFYL